MFTMPTLTRTAGEEKKKKKAGGGGEVAGEGRIKKNKCMEKKIVTMNGCEEETIFTS